MDFSFGGRSLRVFRAKAPLPYFKRFPLLRFFWLPSLFFWVSFVLSVLSWSDIWGPFPASRNLIFEHHYYFNAISAVFYHADIGHLLSNAMLLLFFGWMLNAYFGIFVSIGMSLIIGFFTNVLTVAYYPLDTALIGASGMVYGMAAMWLVLYLKFDKSRRLSHRFARVLGFILLLLFPTSYDPQTSYLAHTIGFVLGVVFAFIILPKVSLYDPTARHHDYREIKRSPVLFYRFKINYRNKLNSIV